MVTERFPCVDVGDVNFDHWALDGSNGICQGKGSMGESPRIQYDPIGRKSQLVKPVNQLAFMVALEIKQFVLRKKTPEFLQKRPEGLAAVDLGLSPAEQIEVGAVDDVQFQRSENFEFVVATGGWVGVPFFF